MPNRKPLPILHKESRLSGEYLVNQVESFRQVDTYQNHKARIEKADRLYRGDLTALFPDETTLPAEPLVDNTFTRAIHDIARLSAEARGMPVFYLQGGKKTDQSKAYKRAAIAETLWEIGGGAHYERKLYMDILGAAMNGIALYYNSDSEYVQMMRLDPRMMYPEVNNGRLMNLLYIERMYTRKAARLFPQFGLAELPEKIDDQVLVVSYYDDHETAQVVMTLKRGKVAENFIQSNWVHELGCVPVAYTELDTFDSAWRGVFDQLGGPTMVRNKAVALMADYLEDMAHAPLEFRGIMNDETDPGPLTRYIHDLSEPTTFVRRVQPGAPASAVFGLVQYLEGQESQIAIQPPARVGQVSQSIASGSFVASTQGGLTSIVRELQDHMSDLRVQAHTIAMKIEEKHLNREKSMMRAVEGDIMYTPKKDIDGFYHHRVLFGAAAGLNRLEADVRVANHVGLGLISKAEGRRQVDYLDNQSNMQDEIDREDLAKNLKDRLVGSPQTPPSVIARLLISANKGKSFLDAVEEVLPEMLAAEERAAQAAAPQGPAVPGTPGPAPEGVVEGTGVPAAEDLLPVGLPAPFTQVAVRTPGRF